MRLLLTASLCLPLSLYAAEVPDWLAEAAPDLALPGRWTELRSIWQETSVLAISRAQQVHDTTAIYYAEIPVAQQERIAALFERLRRLYTQPEQEWAAWQSPAFPRGIDNALERLLYDLLKERLWMALGGRSRREITSRMALPPRGSFMDRHIDFRQLEMRLEYLSQLRSAKALDEQAYQHALNATAADAVRVLSWRLFDTGLEELMVGAGLRLSLEDGEHILPVFDALGQAILARVGEQEEAALALRQRIREHRSRLELLIKNRSQLPALIDALQAP